MKGYIIIHFAAHMQAHHFIPRTAITPFRLTWADLYLLFQKPGAQEQMEVSGKHAVDNPL